MAARGSANARGALGVSSPRRQSAGPGFIAGLLQPRLPAGKTRWGFKEIQYGHRDRTPELLLDLFPGGTIIHTLRHPRSTLESAMQAWYPTALKQAAADPTDAEAAYAA